MQGQGPGQEGKVAVRRRRWFLLPQEEPWREAPLPGLGRDPGEGTGHAE